MPGYARRFLPFGLILALLVTVPAQADQPSASGLFARDNLIAWCIVPFDSKQRGPAERAAMLRKLGFRHFAYDWRAKDIPTFDAEVEALKKEGVALDAFWCPGGLNDESRTILKVLGRHGVKAQLWVLLDQGSNFVEGPEQTKRVEAASNQLKPLAEEAAKAGCSLALYNHGGWFGEPENQVAIIQRLKAQGISNVGMVYNLHHGHEHTRRLAEVLKLALPYLKAVNLNGMDSGPNPGPRKILPLGQGSLDLAILRTIVDSGYKGPIGILGHTNDDAEARLQDNLDGLDWLVRQLDGLPAGPRPKPRTPVPPLPPGGAAEVAPGDAPTIAALLGEAKALGDPRRGAEVFASARFACLSCHRVAGRGGEVGPDLSGAGACIKPEEVVEAILWPSLKVKEGYDAVAVATLDGKLRRAYKDSETADQIVLRDPASREVIRLPKAEVEGVQHVGTLMPEGLAASMTRAECRDLVRFLIDLGKPGTTPPDSILRMAHAPAEFTYDRAPLDPSRYPDWQAKVNRDRLYDFYAKEADHFSKMAEVPPLLPQFPGLDGPVHGHWGNQNENTWVDGRWNRTDIGNLISGVFRGAGVTVPKAVCVRLGEDGEVSACFNPETLTYDAAWSGGFIKFAPKRYGFLDGILMDGTPLPKPSGDRPAGPFVYHGFYRHGKRVVFSYSVGGVEMLDAPWAEGGKFTRVVAPANEHPSKDLIKGGPSKWPQVIETKGKLGQAGPYAIDTIEPPFENPWNALLFFGDHDFLPDGSALICTMEGDVWHVTGLDATLEHVKWRRFATGLHQALGLVVAEGKAYVLGRDQITRLTDLDGDGEADFHECVNNAYITSTAGHDFICGLQRDASGNFYTVSGKQGVIRISSDGRSVETLATGFRNADGVGLGPDGTLTVPSSEGEWVPASMVAEIKAGAHYGYTGPKGTTPPDLPLVYLPRGIDNSSGGQVFAASDRFGPLGNHWIHLSFGAGAAFLLLRDQVDGQPQGAVVPIPGEFASGVHRGRMNPKDGQLYVSGMAGWGTYTTRDGCFQRVRYTGEAAQYPVGFHAVENGVLVTFSNPLDRASAQDPRRHFVQAWNYHYSPGYGSQELSPSHPGTPGHDPWTIASAHVLDDGRTLFLELPDLQPVNQIHLRLKIDDKPVDLYATVHKLAPPFTGFPGYAPRPKTIAAHPILADMAALLIKPTPNPWAKVVPGARSIRIEAGKNLTFTPSTFKVKAGEMIKLSFVNPDVVPHNWALIKPGTLAKVGDLANRIITEPDAVARRYIPRTDDVLAYTDLADPQGQSVIYFKAPTTPGRYPYLCTFPGHWMVMNGEMVVE